MAVASRGYWLSLFSAETGKKIGSLPVSEGVVSPAFLIDGKTLAVASDANLRVSPKTGTSVIQVWELTNLQTPSAKFPSPGVRFVTISPEGKTLAWSGYQQKLCFVERATGKDLLPTESHLGAIKALAYLPDGKRIVSASEDGAIRIWDAETGKSLSVLRGHAGAVLGLAVSPNGKLLVSCGADGTLRLWNLEDGKSVAVRNDEGNQVLTAAFSPDGKWLAKVQSRVPVSGDAIKAIAFSPDGTLRAVGGKKKIRIWNVSTGKVEGECSDFPKPVEAVAFSGDGKALFSGHRAENVLRRWEN